MAATHLIELERGQIQQMNPKEERAIRIKEIAERLLSAASALEREDWKELHAQALEVSREARVLELMEKESHER